MIIFHFEDRIYKTDISNTRWIAYDIPGNVGWIIYIVCLLRCLLIKPNFISSGGLFEIRAVAVLPAIFMVVGIAELVSERIAKLDRKLPKVRLLRGFGALVMGGVLGMVISTIGLIYGYCIGERNLLTIWLMLLGCFLCFIFAELIYKTYK